MLGVFLVVFYSTSYADEFHYNNLLIGGKAIGLGGAYVAISDDLSAMHYNPAGLSFTKVKYSASINTLAWDKTDVFGIFGNGDSFSRKSFTVVPGFFGVSGTTGQYSYGGYFAVTDNSKERTATDAVYITPGVLGADQQKVNEFNNVDLDNSAYRIGFTTAYNFGDHSSIGASINVDYKEFTTVQGSGATFTEILNGIPIFSGFNASVRFSDINLIIQPAVGFLKKWDSFSFGFKVARDFVISRDYDITSTLFLNSPVPLPSTILTSVRINASGNEKQEYPYQIHTGFSHEFERISISIDLSYYTKVNTTPFYIDNVKPITRTLDAVNNISIGLQYKFNEDETLRFGLFTDNSNASINPNVDFERVEDIDLIGVSLGVDMKFYDTPVSFGAYYKYGDGNIRIADRRIAEAVMGLPLFPDDGNFDVFEVKKKSLVVYISVDF